VIEGDRIQTESVSECSFRVAIKGKKVKTNNYAKKTVHQRISRSRLVTPGLNKFRYLNISSF